MANSYHINVHGYGEVLNDYHTRQQCLSIAQLIALNARAMGGGPYRCDVQRGVSRAHARATTASEGAAFQELRTRALSRSLPKGGQMSPMAREKYREKLQRYYEWRRKKGLT